MCPCARVRCRYDPVAQNVGLPHSARGAAWFNDMCAAARDVFAAAAADPRRFLALRRCREPFGLDFIIEAPAGAAGAEADVAGDYAGGGGGDGAAAAATRAGRVFLLEVNADPSFAVYGATGEATRAAAADPAVHPAAFTRVLSVDLCG